MAAQLNSEDVLAVRRNIVDRCTRHVANYALYLLGLPGTTEQLAWAREAIKVASSIGEQVSWHVINEPAFLGQVSGSDWSGGSSINDDTLKGVVEAAINNHFIQPAA